ncbi:hypothetical protein M0R04_14175 [Candidatus Dojkabacteria bacterium]|jgi:hypothetical protein|nr:hypothetical protein [Candidatus Dojkabacteria bacterium]
MAFNQQEQEIIKWGLDNNKSRQEVERAIVNYRTGIVPQAQPVAEPSFLQGLKSDILQRADKVGVIQARDSSIPEKAVQTFGQGAGAAANVIEKTAEQIPGVKQTFGAIGSGINWLATSDKSPIKALGNVIGESKALQEAVKLYDTDQNFKDSVDAVANIARLGGDVQLASDAVNLTKNLTSKIKANVEPTVTGVRTALENAPKVSEGLKSVLKTRDEKLLAIFSGEETSVVKKALENPQIADLGITQGDTALRTAVNQGAESSIKARQTFTQAYGDAFKTLVKDNPAKVTNRQKVLYQFTDELTNQGVKIKNGKLDFKTSKIVANPGEITKINNAYEAIKGWKDFSLQGTNELKQLVGQLTKFATEAGGSSKSPFLGRFYKYLDDQIKGGLTPEAKLQYETMNKKFGDTIGLYDDMVKAFNSGDPFTKLAQLFGKNKDALRQVIDFYESTTGNQIAPIVAGRTLAMEKQAAFGFLNPRSWVDFFIPPEVQAKIVTGYGKLKNQSLNEAKTAPIKSGTNINPSQTPKIDKTIISPKSTTKGLKGKGEIPTTNLISEAKKYKSAEELSKNTYG